MTLTLPHRQRPFYPIEVWCDLGEGGIMRGTMTLMHNRRFTSVLGSLVVAMTMARAASAAAPLRVVAIADDQHRYDGHDQPLHQAQPPVIGTDGEVAFDADAVFGTPIMEKAGKLLTVDPAGAGATVLARYADHVVYHLFDGKDVVKARDGKDGSVSTILSQGDVVESATVGVFSNMDLQASVRTNMRGDVIVADYAGHVFAVPYKGAKTLLSAGPAPNRYSFLDAEGRFVMHDMSVRGVVSGAIGTLGSNQPWWESQVPGHNPDYMGEGYPMLAGVGRTGIAVATATIRDSNGDGIQQIFTGSIGAPGKAYERKPGFGMNAGAFNSFSGPSVCMMRNNDFAFEGGGFVENDTPVVLAEGGTPRVLADKNTTIDGYRFVDTMSNTSPEWASNDVGQLAFVHKVTNGGEELPALFLYTPGKGLETVLRAGEEILLEPNKKVRVTNILMARGCDAGEPIVLDDTGRIAFSIGYADPAGGPGGGAIVVSGATSPLGTADLELGEPRNLVATSKRYIMGGGYESWVTLELDIPAKNLGPEAAATSSLDVVFDDETGPDGKRIISRAEHDSVSEGNVPICNNENYDGYSNEKMSCALRAFEPSRERLIHLSMLVVVSSNAYVGKEVSFELVLNSPNEGRFDNNTRRVKFIVPPDANALGSSTGGCSTMATPHTDGVGLGAGIAAVGVLWGARRRRREPARDAV